MEALVSEWAASGRTPYDFKNLLSPSLVVNLRSSAYGGGRRRHTRGRLPGTGTYPTRDSLMDILLPAYRSARKLYEPAIPPMKAVLDEVGLSYSRLRALRSQFDIAWPPE